MIEQTVEVEGERKGKRRVLVNERDFEIEIEYPSEAGINVQATYNLDSLAFQNSCSAVEDSIFLNRNFLYSF